MRIAYLTQSYPPMISGAAFVVGRLAAAMADRGHQVLVIAASDREQPYAVLHRNITVLRLRSFHNPFRVGQRLLFHPRREVMKALHDFHPEIIHVHEPAQTAWLGIEYARQRHIPLTLTIHQLPGFVSSYLSNSFGIYTETVLWIYVRWLLRNFTSLITPTQTTSDLVTRMTGLHANTISNGIDLGTFHPRLSRDAGTATRQKWNLPLRVPLLLHVGRLDADKRVDRVILAAARTMGKTDAHLLIVGDGVKKPALIRLCKSLGISDRVHFTGYVSQEDGLAEIYRTANLFVTASEIETQGIVLLEAAASGLPMVAVRATCIPEIVRDGVNGYLAEPGDLHGLSNAMSLLIGDPHQASFMGKASRTLAENHDIRCTFDAHEQLYHHLVQQVRAQTVKAGAGFRRHEWTNFSE